MDKPEAYLYRISICDISEHSHKYVDNFFAKSARGKKFGDYIEEVDLRDLDKNRKLEIDHEAFDNENSLSPLARELKINSKFHDN